MAINIGSLVAKFNLDSTKFVSNLDKAVGETRVATSSMGGSFQRLGSIVKATVGVFAVKALASFGEGLAKTTAEFESIDRTLRFATGSVKSGAEAFNFARSESLRLGLSLEVAAKQYGQLAAAAKGTALEGEQTELIFKAISSAAAVMGMDARKTELAFTAFQQMISKGTINAEEMRQQLGDHLPGAMQILARSLKVTTQELGSLMQKGALLSEQVLPRFAHQILLELGGSVEEATTGIQAALGRLGTAWFEFRKMILDEQGLGNAIKFILGLLTTALNKVTAGIRSLVDLWNNYVSPILQKAKNFYETIFGTKADQTETIAMQKAMTSATEEHTEALSKFQDLFSGGGLTKADTKKIFKGIETSVSSLSGALAELSVKGKVDIKSLAISIIRNLNEMILQFYVTKPIVEELKSIFTSFQTGGGINIGGFFGGIFSFAKAALGFANGGIITEPIVGMGIETGTPYTLAEKGPEAVVPMADLGSGQSVQANNIAINISAVDSQSLVLLMRKNPQAVVAPIIEALQVGDKGLMTSLRGAVI